MSKEGRIYDLEERLIEFGIRIILNCCNERVNLHLCEQHQHCAVKESRNFMIRHFLFDIRYSQLILRTKLNQHLCP
jgi:hypothetical protein